MNDQKKHWNRLHEESREQGLGPSTFAQKVLKIISKESNILELGCGAGIDSVSFASTGHNVLATDFSDLAIAKNNVMYSSVPNLHFQTLDIQNLTQFLDNEFDLVYARLSLHYFSDLLTQKIFEDIYRVLVPGGYFCWVCKSTDDPLYGKGQKLEENMYEYKGHVRHFFSKNYVESLLKKNFKIDTLIKSEEEYYGKKSSFVSVIARAKK